MSIHTRKQIWKRILSVSAILIVALSFWYTNILVSEIAEKERKEVKLWADAIQKKAKLVRYTNDLFSKLTIEERKKVELWAEATKQLANADNMTDYTFVLKVVADNTTVPVILADDKHEIISHRNLDKNEAKSSEYLEEQLEIMAGINEPIEISIYGSKKNYLYYKDSRLFEELKDVLDDLVESFISEVVANSASVPVILTDEARTKLLSYGNISEEDRKNHETMEDLIKSMVAENEPIKIELGDNRTSYLFYKDSSLLRQLRNYPVIQLCVIGLFTLIGYWLFSMARNYEQNQVWVGMAKETAHQLGTPLSSLMAWMEILDSRGVDKETIAEMGKDIERLDTITDRFSKIGSTPKLTSEDVLDVLKKSILYMEKRSSDKVIFNLENETANPIHVKLNIPLFEWVIENLFKNAIDAINGDGNININVGDHTQMVFIDISDTGKGIPSKNHKTVFEPGYTTKKRGWGLGLSLTKRIMENYHEGKIFVQRSEPEKGTTFRIVLKKG